MLVLTRKERQQIMIGDNIVVTVVRTKGNTVRLGIEAPQGIRILRSELTEGKPDSARPRHAGTVADAETPRTSILTMRSGHRAIREPVMAR